MRNLAGDVLQIVCPRTADNDGVVQIKGNSKERNSVCNATGTLARLRTEPAILDYKWQRHRVSGAFATCPGGGNLFRGNIYRSLWLMSSRSLNLRSQRRSQSTTPICVRLLLKFPGFLAIQNTCQIQQGLGRAGWTLCRAVPNTVAILAQIRSHQRNVLHCKKRHRFTLNVISRMNIHGFPAMGEVSEMLLLSFNYGCNAVVKRLPLPSQPEPGGDSDKQPFSLAGPLLSLCSFQAVKPMTN